MKRSAAREIAIQLGFAAAATGQAPERVVEDFFEPEYFASLAAESPLYMERPTDEDYKFIMDSVSGVIERQSELDGYIGKYARGWRPDRISRSAVAVLRQAIYEILCQDNIPPAVSIDEAVELAKNYEDDEIVAFINGVLGGFYRGEVLGEKSCRGEGTGEKAGSVGREKRGGEL